MDGHPARSVHRALIGAVALACVALFATMFAGHAQARTVSAARHSSPAAKTPPPVTAGSGYLALGDSVTFGYVEPNSIPTPDYTDASNFVGFPEDIASDLGLTLANAACPGETSSSFINDTAQSNGCETEPGGSPGYRAAYPLHESYPGSQLAYAVKYLKANKDVTLVSLMIGANDYFLCQETTADECQSAAEQDAVLAKIKHNLKKILSTLRGKAGYKGQIVLVNYYSPVSEEDGLSEVLNVYENRVAAPYHVETADGFDAYMAAEASAGYPDDPCSAGLLTELVGGGCGIHPSSSGQTVLADAVESVIQTGDQ